jgi:hypothetical protein
MVQFGFLFQQKGVTVMFFRISILFCILISFTTSCATIEEEAGFNAAQKTLSLRPGMSYPEVVRILGKPKSSIFNESEWQVNYSLHEYWKGWVPYVLIFDKKTLQLKTWMADEETYQKNQLMWMQVLHSLETQQASQSSYRQSGSKGYSGSENNSGYSSSGVTVPNYDSGYSEPSQFELDSAGYPGGAYDNPSSSYYDYN